MVVVGELCERVELGLVESGKKGRKQDGETGDFRKSCRGMRVYGSGCLMLEGG